MSEKLKDIESPTHSFCVECGPNMRVDSDGCCATCGCGAMGPYVDKIGKLVAERNAYRATRTFWPLHLREAIARGDVAACAADAEAHAAFAARHQKLFIELQELTLDLQHFNNRLVKECETAETRVKVLETALRAALIGWKNEVDMGDGFPETEAPIYEACKEALNSVPVD